MVSAVVGDEQVGEDPTVRALCERVAALLGKEDAVFLPSGTMCNHIAILAQVRPGDEVILAQSAHLFNSESAGAAALAGAQLRPVACDRGRFGADAVLGAVRPAKRNAPRTSLIAIEQTTSRGANWSLAELETVTNAAKTAGLRLHMDGARLLNAQVATGIAARDMAAGCDTVWLDLSKGLGCPIGAVLTGSFAFIEEAWSWKFRLGGAMRQAGFLAAAGLYALDHHIDRLAEDHTHARLLATTLATLHGVRIDPGEVESNIVYFDVAATGRSAADIIKTAASYGLALGADGATGLRAVTHLGISGADIATAQDVLTTIFKG